MYGYASMYCCLHICIHTSIHILGGWSRRDCWGGDHTCCSSRSKLGALATRCWCQQRRRRARTSAACRRHIVAHSMYFLSLTRRTVPLVLAHAYLAYCLRIPSSSSNCALHFRVCSPLACSLIKISRLIVGLPPPTTRASFLILHHSMIKSLLFTVVSHLLGTINHRSQEPIAHICLSLMPWPCCFCALLKHILIVSDSSGGWILNVIGYLVDSLLYTGIIKLKLFTT